MCVELGNSWLHVNYLTFTCNICSLHILLLHINKYTYTYTYYNIIFYIYLCVVS